MLAGSSVTVSLAWAALVWLCAAGFCRAADTPLEAVDASRVRWTQGFWAERWQTVRANTWAANRVQCEKTGRLSNFDKAAGRAQGAFEGLYFNDSDVYKALEGAIVLYQLEPEASLKAQIDAWIDRIAAAQQPDGYLNTYFTLTPAEPRWTQEQDKHETYCAGHLIEAAVAHFGATGERRLLDVAVKLADHVDSVFGPGRNQLPPGHQEIELALVKLYEVTREPRYLKLAQFLVDQRGNADGHTLYGEYAQDHLPVRQQREIVGHAVRAMYLYAALADLTRLNGDAGYRETLDAIWKDVVQRKMFITGGIGSSASNEGFTTAYDLPNENAYAETCAAIGLVLFNQRMNRLTAEARYADVLERALYNGVLSGLSLDGRQFFYVNPLSSRGDHRRQDWYACACCPPNLLRLFASLGGYVYMTGPDALYVNLYGANRADVPMADGKVVRIEQTTRYPWDGRVTIRFAAPVARELALHLRIPAWCAGASLQLNGQPQAIDLQRGYAVVRRIWESGDTVELELPMPVRRMYAHPRVAANVGRVALMRGPLVYCFEAADNGDDLARVVLPPDADVRIEEQTELLGGVSILRVRGLAQPDVDWDAELYASMDRGRPVELTAVPYYAWANRASGAMHVWLPETFSVLPLPPVAWLNPSASHCWRSDTLTALCDRLEPSDSGDPSLPRFTWWPRRGSSEWVQYDFTAPRTVRGVEVYWFDDHARGGQCAPPASWKLLVRQDGAWREPPGAGACGVAVNQFNRVALEPLTTDGLRIEAQLQPERSAGILEWRVDARE